MRNVAVASDLVRGVDDDDALPHLVREHARDLAKERGLADARTAEEQDAPSGFDDVAYDLHRPVTRPPDAQRETYDLARAVAKRAHAVEGTFGLGAGIGA